MPTIVVASSSTSPVVTPLLRATEPAAIAKSPSVAVANAPGTLEHIKRSLAERADNYEAALARAKATGKDIVVIQRGSDWNRLGETLYHNVWLADDFAEALGDKFILVAVDHAEVLGGRAVRGECSAVRCGVTGFSEVQIGSSPPRHLADICEDDAPIPPSEIISVVSQNNLVYSRRDDGAWIATGGNTPGEDTLTLKMRARTGGSVLRLDFPTDPKLPGDGPGLAHNGNFTLSEVEVVVAGTPVKFVADWASATEGDWGAWLAIDGVNDRSDNFWNPLAHQHQRRTLLLVLASPVPAGASLEVRLICKSPWGQHIPGSVRAAVLADKAVDGDVRLVSQAQVLQSRNRQFSWWDKTYCPRIALMDSEGRAVACENKPRLELTSRTMAARIMEMRAVREKRDALWAEAEQARGPAKAELLRRSLSVMGFANWDGNDHCYKFVHDEIRAADPADESGAIRWLGFGSDPRSGVPWAKPSWNDILNKKDLTDADYEAAVVSVNKELHDPRNRVLDHEQIQRIMIAKFLIDKRWPGHEDQRFEVQREIAALDSTTFWGIGATGYLGMFHRTEAPMLTYGWAASQVQSGLNTWDMTDTAYFFDHAGPYKVRMNTTGGSDALMVKRIALLDGATVLAEAAPDAVLGPDHRTVEVTLDLKDWREDRKVVLRVEAQATEGRTDSAGNFDIQPELLPITPVAGSRSVAAATTSIMTFDDITSMQQKLSDTLAAKAAAGAADLERVMASPQLRADLARYEVIHVCGENKVADIAAREGGSTFLQAFFGDTNWMESFLASDPADSPQALENLWLLSRYEPLSQPLVHQRIATALALEWGDGNRYRLVERYRQVLGTLQQGFPHRRPTRLAGTIASRA